jgi:hypothetical protein
MAILLVGCVSSPARQVAAIPDFHATQDYDQMNESFAALGRIAKRHLRDGMTPQHVEKLMGKPKMKDKWSNRVELWTYLVSISGTWQYIVAFLDGKIEYFGEANSQWMGWDEEYNLPGAERLIQVMREHVQASREQEK